jgi:SNF2 family DNA or RNA helicase
MEEALRQGEPSELELTTVQAYEFLREYRTLLSEQGFGVIVPEWWDSPASRLGVRLRIDTGDAPEGAGAGGQARPSIGLGTLVNYQWQISIGSTVLSLQEFEKLATMRTPLVMIGGKWVEVRPEDVQAAVDFIRENPGGQMELGKAMRLAFAADVRETGVPIVGMDASGWLSSLLGNAGLQGNVPQQLQMVEPPSGFVGSLRHYQLKGLSWLSFLDRIGLGACLADDMGLGKTIQLIAMLLRERELSPGGAPVAPTLLVVPMSVVGNWVRECNRFAPALRVLVHHGLTRKTGEALVQAAINSDLVVTTYALAHRDREHLEKISWQRISLDEAQNIKNPGTKQTKAIRSLDAPRRIALTGTPIENRLSELWSIMDFLNPGLLGTVHEFRTRFALPIERYHDQNKSKTLRGLVQPFVLRRLKTDPTVIADLPEKVETKEYCYLTPEQATLYEQTVKHMLSSAESAEGIQRRGVILAGLVKLKQICNHPLQFLKEHDPQYAGAGAVASLARSGKCARLVQMLDEVVASGGQALVFTQFRQMGDILAAMLRHELNKEVLFLHGGTSAKDRDAMVQAFQKGDGSSPIFVLSLKAGGVGLNLTGANHVFHFDRWWNPAVENQATDRAFRIGQTRTVQVHKFIVSGTLEEKIDAMIEQKTALADNVIGSGENWLTELSLNQLREVLTLRPDAVEAEDATREEIEA